MPDKILIRWLQGACIVTIAIGLVAAAASHASTQEPWRLLFDLLSWPIDGHPHQFTAEAAAVNAVTGGVMVGWAVLMFAVVTGPIARRDTSMINATLACVVGWFVVDSAGSLAAGLFGNVVLNVGSLLAFVLPLWVLRGRSREVR